MKKQILTKLRRLLGLIFLYKNWREVIDYRNKKLPISHVSLRNGLQFFTADIVSARPIISHTFSRKDGYEVYKDVKKGDVVIDIGAFIGDFSIKAAMQGAMVYAFEPFKITYETLVKNIEVNKLKGKIKTFDYGIYHKKGKQTFTVRGDYGLTSLVGKDVLNHRSNYLRTEQLETKPFEDMWNELKLKKCDFLKVDTEGTEAEIVMSIPPKILKKINYISMESTDYYNTGKNKKLIQYLEDNGFTLKLIMPPKKLNIYDIVRIFAKNEGEK